MFKKIRLIVLGVIATVCFGTMIVSANPNPGSECNHDWTGYSVVKQATCINAGDKARVCKKCGVETHERIGPTGHDWTDYSVTKEDTENSDCELARFCKNCGYETKEIFRSSDIICRLPPVININGLTLDEYGQSHFIRTSLTISRDQSKT